MSDTAEERLAAGDPHGALAALQERVRARPADAAARVFLFQLLCVLGEWSRAANQLDVAAELDSGAKLMAQTYRELIRCEALREAVFDGRRAPMVLGEPPVWLAALVQALPLAAAGDGVAAARLANDAFEQAPSSAGHLGGAPPDDDDGGTDETGGDASAEIRKGEASDGVAFDWFGDADMRLGPVLEAMIDGKYYWVPFERLAGLVVEPPSDLRDLVWTPVEFHWHGGGKGVGFVPTRYPHAGRMDGPDHPGSPESSSDSSSGDSAAAGQAERSEPQRPDPACLMARKSDWIDLGGDYYVGRGQRVFASSAGDHALLDCRTLRFDTPGGNGADG